MSEYRYTECGLNNVVIKGAEQGIDETGEKYVIIPDIKGLHKKIARHIIQSSNKINGNELRFLRSEIGLTPEELAEILHVKVSTLIGWEKGDAKISKISETVIRILTAQELNLDEHVGVRKVDRQVARQVSYRRPEQIQDFCVDENRLFQPGVLELS